MPNRLVLGAAALLLLLLLAVATPVQAGPAEEAKCKSNCDGLERHCIKYCSGIKFTGGRANELGVACENGCRVDCGKCQRKCEVENAPKPKPVVAPVVPIANNTTKPVKAPKSVDVCSAARIKTNPLLEVPCACANAKKAGRSVSPACAKFAEAENLHVGEKAAAAAVKPVKKPKKTNAKKAATSTGAAPAAAAGTSTGAAAPSTAGSKIGALKAKATF